MKNKALISLSFLVLFGTSACSTSSQKPEKETLKKSGAQKQTSPTAANNHRTVYNQQWQAKQNAIAAENEKKRLAYNYEWQRQQLTKNNTKAKNQQSAYQYTTRAMQRPLQQHVPQGRKPQSNIANLSASEIRTIGDKIFRNESGGDIDKLVHWNVGENFASMGIGHFTWYPAGRRKRYGNTFPGLLDHLKANGVQLPAWVQKARYTGAPWRTKNELKYAKNSPKVRQFQNLLYQTRYLQAGYIFERAKRAMPRLVKATPQHLRSHVAQNLNAVANTRGGWYALIDYVNFKGEGLNRKGGYRGQNWGLLQVLENMRPSQPGQMALNNFADSAIQILQRRVRNSNPKRGESRWMRGWTIRCNSYRQPFVI